MYRVVPRGIFGKEGIEWIASSRGFMVEPMYAIKKQWHIYGVYLTLLYRDPM